jgi:hypothetical protein
VQNPSGSDRERVKRSRGMVLLRELIAVHAVARETLADVLQVPEATIDAYVSGREPMSLRSQSDLAAFVIERVPSLRRIGHRLQAQTAAAVDYHQGRTARHTGSPPRS